jgi:hypothetical protein
MIGNFIKPALGGFIVGSLIAGGIVYLAVESSRGLPPRYGDIPGNGNPANNGIYNPKHYAVVYMQFGTKPGDPALTARHAYFKGNGSKSEVDCAISVLRNSAAPQPANCQTIGEIRQGLQSVEFGKPLRIFAFVDNSNIQFNKRTPVSFAPFGAFETPDDDPTSYTRQPNESFYNADVTLIGTATKGLYIENHFQGTNHGPVGNSPLKYAINFNLLICANAISCDFDDKSQVIPMAIDPDTGNGLGYPP